MIRFYPDIQPFFYTNSVGGKRDSGYMFFEEFFISHFSAVLKIVLLNEIHQTISLCEISKWLT